jgi:hypothetical protein
VCVCARARVCVAWPVPLARVLSPIALTRAQSSACSGSDRMASALGALDPSQLPPLVVFCHKAHSHAAATLQPALARAVHVVGVVARKTVPTCWHVEPSRNRVGRYEHLDVAGAELRHRSVSLLQREPAVHRSHLGDALRGQLGSEAVVGSGRCCWQTQWSSRARTTSARAQPEHLAAQSRRRLRRDRRSRPRILRNKRRHAVLEHKPRPDLTGFVAPRPRRLRWL